MNFKIDFMTKVNLEEELEKFKKTVEENPNLYNSPNNFNLSRTTRNRRKIWRAISSFTNLAKKKYGADYSVCELICETLYYKTGPFQIRPDRSISVKKPVQLFKRLRGRDLITDPISNLKDISKKIGFRGFNLEAKNFIANVYKVFYDTYLKPRLEKIKRGKQSQYLSEYEKGFEL